MSNEIILASGVSEKGRRLYAMYERRFGTKRNLEVSKMRKKVYIAGPIQKGNLCANVNQATDAFVALAKAGFAPMCAHWSVYSKPATWSHFGDGVRVECVATAMGNDEMTYEDWMAVDLPWVAVSDAVLRLPGESTGADLETAHARTHGIPVFTSIDELMNHFAAKQAS